MTVTTSAFPSTPLTITLFGPMQVRIHDRPLPHLRSRKALWLLALLALRHGLPVEREWLAGTLWPDTDQSQASTYLSVILSELRRALGDQSAHLQSPSRRTLSLALEGANIDVVSFDAAILSKKPEGLKQAVALYRAPLLEDCAEEWVGQERNIREQDCLLALQILADVALAAGDPAAAIDYCRRAVSLDPWREGARRGWMEALAKSGDRNAALQVYREYVEWLHTDPSAVPDEETSALYHRLRTEARRASAVTAAEPSVNTTLPRSVRGYLPHPLTDLIGCEDERIKVAAKLRGSRLVTLTGPGGIGKTRLAIEVANEILQDGTAYPDGVWLVALELLSEGRLVVAQVASVLGLREEPGRSWLESLTDYLRTKRLLLVLDNCEHLVEASAQVSAHLLRECSTVRILATSREALGITGENVLQVPALPVPDTAHLPPDTATLLQVLMRYESVELFVERAQAVQKAFAPTRSNAMAVAQVCSQLEGIPLAIELAAARVRALTVEQIAERLDDHLNLLIGRNRAAQSRQQTLRATLDWSYALLSQVERSLLGRVSVFAGGWTLEAAERVCSGEDIKASQILDLLASLVDKSLVVFGGQQHEAGGRYYLLEMVRQYAAENLHASGEAEAVKRRHQEWYLTFAEQAEPALRTGEQEMWLMRLESEHGNIRAALAWSLKTGIEGDKKGEQAQPFTPLLLRFCSALQPFWHTRAHLAEGRTWCQRALQAEGAQERTALRAKVLNRAGILAYMQGDYTSARAYFEGSLQIEREIGNRSGIAASLNSLGNLANNRGDYVAARAYHEESLQIEREIGNRSGIAASLNNVGNVVSNQGDYVAARAYFEESLQIEREIGNRSDIASTLNNLGVLALHQGDYAVTQARYEESLAIRREIGERRSIAASLDNLGGVANVRGDYPAAKAYHKESLAIRREIGDRSGIASTLNNLGNAIYNQGDYPAAKAHYEESLAIWRDLGERLGIANSLHNLGNMIYNQGDYPAARAYHGESLAINREIGSRIGIISSLEAFAVLIAAEATAFTAPVETTKLSREPHVEMRRVARLRGAAQALREQIGAPLPPREQEIVDRQIAQAQTVLGTAAFTQAWEEGSAMTLEQAIGCVIRE